MSVAVRGRSVAAQCGRGEPLNFPNQAAIADGRRRARGGEAGGQSLLIDRGIRRV